MGQADFIDLLKFAIPLLGAAIAWLWNERWRRLTDEYQRKEQKYTSLIEAAEGFYAQASGTPEGKNLKTQFLLELKKCWLYCPDDVIKSANRWLDLMHEGAGSTNEARKAALGEFMVAVRKDLLSRKPVRRTDLTAADFKHVRAT
jgi:hypothetical protein